MACTYQNEVSSICGGIEQHLVQMSTSTCAKEHSQPSTMASLADIIVGDELTGHDEIRSIGNDSISVTEMDKSEEEDIGLTTVNSHSWRPVSDPWKTSFLPDASRVRSREEKIVYALTVVEGILASSARICDPFSWGQTRRATRHAGKKMDDVSMTRLQSLADLAETETQDNCLFLENKKCRNQAKCADVSADDCSTMSSLPDYEGADPQPFIHRCGSESSMSDLSSEVATSSDDDQECDP